MIYIATLKDGYSKVVVSPKTANLTSFTPQTNPSKRIISPFLLSSAVGVTAIFQQVNTYAAGSTVVASSDNVLGPMNLMPFFLGYAFFLMIVGFATVFMLGQRTKAFELLCCATLIASVEWFIKIAGFGIGGVSF